MNTTAAYDSTTSASLLPECKPVFRPDIAAFQVVVFIDIVWNALVLWAIVKSRKKLRQNLVYSFVASLVFANIALAAVMVLTLFSFLTPFERPPGVHGYDESPFIKDNASHRAIMHWFNFRKALVVGLFLTMSSNMVVLIGGIIQNASFVGRAGASTARARARQRTPSITRAAEEKPELTRHQKASLYIFLAWFVPFIYTLLSFANTDCINYCECLPGYYSKQYFCSNPSGKTVNTCSNVWTPMTNGYLLAAVTLWFLQSIAMFVLLAKAIQKYKSVMRPNDLTNQSLTTSSKSSAAQIINRDINENQNNGSKDPDQTSETKRESQNVENTGETLSNSQNGRTRNGSQPSLTSNRTLANGTRPNNRSLKKKNPLHPTIKLLIALSFSYTISTAPMMTCFAIDAFVNDENAVDDVTVTVASIIIIIYTLICPGFLVAYMPGLRKALVRFLLPLSCTTTTTTVVNRMARLATMKRRYDTK